MSEFSEEKFMAALSVTKKIKTGLKPFLEQFSKDNIPWIYQSISILRGQLASPTVEPLMKMNSIFAVKCVVDTCEYVALTFVEAYLGQFILDGALADAKLAEAERGIHFFDSSQSRDQNISNYGYNYVKLCTELLSFLAVIKPKNTHFSQETTDDSTYAIAFARLKSELKDAKQLNNFVFFKEKPEALRSRYLEKLAQFQSREQSYINFVDALLFEGLKSNFKNQGLDIRILMKIGDSYACECAMQRCSDVLQKKQNLNLILSALQLFSYVIRAGHLYPAIELRESEGFKLLVKEVINTKDDKKDLSRGEHFMADKKGTPEQRKAVYCELLKLLQLWSSTFTRNSLHDPKTLSRVTHYYESLKEECKYQFPIYPSIKKDVEEAEKNYQRNASRNQEIKRSYEHEIKQEKDDSIIIACRKKAQGQGSRSTIPPQAAGPAKKIQQSKQSRSETTPLGENKVSLEAISLGEQSLKNANTPQVCEKKLNRIIEAFRNLAASEKTLPNNIRVIEDELKAVQQIIQVVEGDPRQVDALVEKYVEIEEEYDNNLRPVYQQYRKNQINYGTFCDKILRNPSSKTFSSEVRKLPNLHTVSLSKGSSEQQSLFSKEQPRVSPAQSPGSERLMEEEIPTRTSAHHSLNPKPIGGMATEERSQASGQGARPPSNKVIEQSNGINELSQGTKQSNVPQEVSYGSAQRSEIMQQNSNRAEFRQQSLKSIPKQGSQAQFILDSKTDQSGSKQGGQAQFVLQQKIQQSRSKESSQAQFILQQKIEESLPSKTESKRQSSQLISRSPPHLVVSNDQKVNFQTASINESRFTNSVRESRIKQPFLEQVQYGTSSKQFIKIEPEVYAGSRGVLPSYQTHPSVDFKPVTYGSYEHRSPPSQDALTPIKKSRNLIEGLEEQAEIMVPDDEIIEGPSLHPLNNSYHNLEAEADKKQIRTFKDAIAPTISSQFNKKEKLFWLEAEANSLIRTVGNSQKKSRIEPRANVVQILQERNKKHELDLKYLEQAKDRKIKQLESKLTYTQKQKSIISENLRAKELQIRSIRQNSDIDGGRSRADQYNIIDDQNYLMKKLKQNSVAPRRNMDTTLKSQSRILTQGQLINAKIYAPYFARFGSEKQKKIHMKNKQLLFKDNALEIGYMGHLEAGRYKITCYLTPEQSNLVLEDVAVENDGRVRVEHNLRPNMMIPARKQEKTQFSVEILSVPYDIPEVKLKYSLDGVSRTTTFSLPCTFHKFFTIRSVDESEITRQFESKNVIRGQEIPYSKKILKNIDLLQDYLPQLRKLNRGDPNEQGEVCYGGEACYLGTRFLTKFSVKPNQFLFIQAVENNNEQDRKVIDFFIATLNHFLMKDINWN